MKTLLAVALAIALAAPREARSVEPAHVWKAHEVRRYRYQETAHVGSQFVTLRSTFTERVRALGPRGAAAVDVSVDAVEVCMGRPLRCAAARLPPDGRTLPASIDSRGRLTAPRVLTVYVRDGRTRLGVRDPRATAPSGDAAFDVVPLLLFELLAWPEDHPAAGRAVERRIADAPVRWSLAGVDRQVAKVRVTSEARTRLMADLSARVAAATGALLEARGTLITWQPTKRSSLVVLQGQ